MFAIKILIIWQIKIKLHIVLREKRILHKIVFVIFRCSRVKLITTLELIVCVLGSTSTKIDFKLINFINLILNEKELNVK